MAPRSLKGAMLKTVDRRCWCSLVDSGSIRSPECRRSRTRRSATGRRWPGTACFSGRTKVYKSCYISVASFSNVTQYYKHFLGCYLQLKRVRKCIALRLNIFFNRYGINFSCANSSYLRCSRVFYLQCD